MSAPSENMSIAVSVPRSKPLLLRHLPYFIGAAIAVALAATIQFDGYVHNILMQATTFAIAVFGLSVVLGLCGQINLAQAAFFGFGAYAVGIGTADYQISYWLCLAAGCLIALLAGAVLGMSTLRLGGHYLAMVTISFQQIITLVMINAIWLTHGPDGVSRIGRPDLFQSAQGYLAFCVAVLAIVGYAVWHLPDTRLGRAMRAVRDNELAASVVPGPCVSNEDLKKWSIPTAGNPLCSRINPCCDSWSRGYEYPDGPRAGGCWSAFDFMRCLYGGHSSAFTPRDRQVANSLPHRLSGRGLSFERDRRAPNHHHGTCVASCVASCDLCKGPKRAY